MEPPRGLWASLWNFIRFLPYFIGLLILGFFKGLYYFLFIFYLFPAFTVVLYPYIVMFFNSL